MASRRRTFKMAEQIREFIAWELERSADPRFNLVTITSVVVSPDMRQAKIYWLVSGDDERKRGVDKAFSYAEGYLKRNLAKQLSTRFIPELKFYYDDTLDVSESVIRLLNRVRDEEEKRQESQEGE